MKPKYVNHIITPRSVTVIFSDGERDQMATVQASDVDRYNAACEAIKSGKFDQLVEVIKPEANTDFGSGFVLVGDLVHYKDSPLPRLLSDRMIRFRKASLDLGGVRNFWLRLLDNPNPLSKESLCRFIEKNNVTIRPDGTFILYKRVRNDMTSHYDGKTMHRLGVPLTIDRQLCDLNPTRECSSGLHAAPFNWVERIYNEGLMLELALAPEHVVSVPHKDEAKIRSCWQLPLRIVGKDDNIRASEIKEGDSTKLVSAPETPQVVRKVRKQRRQESAKGGLRVRAATDRITLPGVFMLDAGFRPGEMATVFVTDKRSRFLYICPSKLAKRVQKEHKCIDSKETVILSTGSVSLRSTTLTMAKIWDPSREYALKVVSRNLVEVRLA